MDLDLSRVPTTEGIEAAEDAWAGGVADFGDPEAAIMVQGMPGYFDYRGSLEDELRRQLGDEFEMYRAITPEKMAGWQAGEDLMPMGFTFSMDLAKSWSNFAPISARKQKLVLIKVKVRPEHVIMRGKEEESELVIDANQISYHSVRPLRHALGDRKEGEDVSRDAEGRLRWGRRAAGILFERDHGKILLVLRSDEVMDPGVWAIPGGRIEEGEKAEASAHLETEEEMGKIPPYKIMGQDVYRSGDFEYTTFRSRMKEKDAKKWKPSLNWENDDWRWFSVDRLPEPLHPNVKKLIEAWF
jgi:8-oxo-dGTP pyrophosphatase MutT (NUDIX family)